MTLVDGTGLWCEIAGTECAGRSAIFLDRDGVIVEEVDYLAQPRDLQMIAGAAAGGCALQSIGNIGHPGF